MDKPLNNFIRKIVNDPMFLDLKDHFVSNVPAGRDSDLSTKVCHGMYLGTRHVFNELQRLATDKPEVEKKNSGTGIDPDLEE